MEKFEKGTIIEIKVPNVENPIKAIILDVIAYNGGDYCSEYKYILYAQKKLFKASNSCHWGLFTYETEDGKIEGEEYENWTDFHYEGIIVDCCYIPEVPLEL